MQTRPKIAIIDPNTLSALGLKGMLQNVMPIMTVDIYGSFAEFTTSNTDEYFHYFTNVNIVLDNRDFFNEQRGRPLCSPPHLRISPQGFIAFASMYQNANWFTHS